MAACLIAAIDRPIWLGIVDVLVAAAFAVAAIAVQITNRARVTDSDRAAAYALARRVLLIVPVLLGMFFLAGDRVDWTVLVMGLTWRTWLLLQVLPELVADRRRADER